MAKIIVVTSGKGGVGKTTTSASFAAGLAKRGHRTVVVDFDSGLRNLDLIMGCEARVVYDFINVIDGDATLKQALIKDKNIEHLHILAASQREDKDKLTDEGVARVMKELSEEFEYIVCDSPAGIERGAIVAMYHADEAIIVTNPEISSVRDSDRMIGLLGSKSKKAESNKGGYIREHLVITRFDAERAAKDEMMSIDDIARDVLQIPLLGVIPECKGVLNASNKGKPVIHLEDTPAGQCYDDMVARFLDEERPYRHIDVPKKSWFHKLFGDA